MLKAGIAVMFIELPAIAIFDDAIDQVSLPKQSFI
jgi:hypothetical protein